MPSNKDAGPARRAAPEPPVRRFVFKFLGNGLSGLSTVLSQFLVSRAIGPESLGVLSFVQNHFQQLCGFMDLGFSTTFFYRITQDERRYLPILSLMLCVMGLGFFGIALYVLTASWAGWGEWLWPQVDSKIMFVGLFAGITIYLSRVVVLVPDVAGIAKGTEIFRVLRSAILLALTCLLFWLGYLGSIGFLLLTGVVQAVFVVLCFRLGHRALGGGDLSFSRRTLREGFDSVKGFSQPLILYGLLGILVGLWERWFLQKVAGATQQGYFGLAVNFSTSLFLLTSAFCTVFQREFTVALSRGERTEAARLYRRYHRLLLSLSAVPCIFLAVTADRLVPLVAGARFGEGVLVVSLLALYPIHQTTGHLAVAVLMGSSRTGTYLKIGLARDIIGIGLIYFLVASPSWRVPGLAWGAGGLATKWLLCQGINTQLMQWVSARSLGLSPVRVLVEELDTLLWLAIPGVLTLVVSRQVAWVENPALNLGLSVLAYFVALLGVAAWTPGKFGLDADLKSLRRRFTFSWQGGQA